MEPEPLPAAAATRRGARDALLLFLGSRAILWLAAAFTLALFPGSLSPERGRWDDPLLHDAGDWIDVWARWDSYWFLRIADSGYHWPSSTPAFFPLTPLAIRAVGLATGGHLVVAGVLVSLAAGAAATVLLHRLAMRLTDAATARRAVVALLVFPTSLFLGAVYSESVYLLAAVGALLLAERRQLVLASLVAGLAILTRVQGLALLPALALLAWPLGPRAVTRAIAPAIALGAVYPLTLWLWIGRPFAFLEGQDVWERHLSPAGPFGGVARAIGDGDVLEVACAVLMIALAVVAWRRLGAAYGVYALVALAIPMSFPSDRLGGLYSFPRLCLAAFPCFIAAGALAAGRRHLAAASAAASAILLVVLVVRWSLWQWIA
jgi:hypothetical protein